MPIYIYKECWPYYRPMQHLSSIYSSKQNEFHSIASHYTVIQWETDTNNNIICFTHNTDMHREGEPIT